MPKATEEYENWTETDEEDSNHNGMVTEQTNHEQKYSTDNPNDSDTIITNDGTTNYLCFPCRRSFKYLGGWKRHKKMHQPPGGFACQTCEKTFCSIQDRNKHKQQQHKYFHCQLCKDAFKTLETYLNHIQKVHDGKEFDHKICESCGQQFKSQPALSVHVETKCGTEKLFRCDECGLSYMTQATLAAHKMIHTGEKAYCCSYCGKRFLSRGQLTVHERKHTGEKPYQCEICKKAFSYRESLVTHSSLHTGVKPYMCENCGLRFSCVGNLLKHRRARASTCGLPQFTNVKVAPRASTKVPGTLNMTPMKFVRAKLSKQKNKTLGTSISSDNEDENISQFLDTLLDQDEVSENDGKKVVIPQEDQSNEQLTSNDIVILNIEVLSNSKQDDDLDHSPKQDNEEEEDDQNSSNDCEMEVDRLVIQEPQSPIDDYIKEENIELEDEIVYEVILEDENDVKNISTADDESSEDIPLSFYKDSLIKCGTKNQMVSSIVEVETTEQITILSDSDDNVTTQEQRKRKKQRNKQLYISRLYECTECPKIYHQRKPYVKHLRTYHSLSEKEIAKQFDEEDDGKGLKCKFCRKTYSQFGSLKKHMEEHGPDGALIHKCVCCRQYFATEIEAIDHLHAEHSEKITCSECYRIFPDPESLGAHKRYVHQQKDNTANNSKAKDIEKMNICVKCGRKFTSKYALIDHERSDCGQSPLYECDVCHKFYHSSGSLKTHQTVHTGVLPYKCNDCKKAFRTQGQLKVHSRKHSGEKPFKCDICSKAFAYRESLLTHASLHTGDRRFMCCNCGRKFSCISNLQSHRKHYKYTCGALPNNTKRVSDMIGVSGGSLYINVKEDAIEC